MKINVFWNICHLLLTSDINTSDIIHYITDDVLNQNFDLSDEELTNQYKKIYEFFDLPFTVTLPDHIATQYLAFNGNDNYIKNWLHNQYDFHAINFF